MDEDGRQALARAVYNNMQETAEMLLHWASYGSEGDSAAPLLLGHQDRWGSISLWVQQQSLPLICLQ